MYVIVVVILQVTYTADHINGFNAVVEKSGGAVIAAKPVVAVAAAPAVAKVAVAAPAITKVAYAAPAVAAAPIAVGHGYSYGGYHH